MNWMARTRCHRPCHPGHSFLFGQRHICIVLVSVGSDQIREAVQLIKTNPLLEIM